MATTRYNFSSPKAGDVFLSEDETIFTVVSCKGGVIDFHYELSPMGAILLGGDIAIVSGVTLQLSRWREVIVPILDIFLTNIGNIPFQLKELGEEIDEDKEVRADFLKSLTVPIWVCGFTPGIEEVFQTTPFGWAITPEFYEFGMKMGLSSLTILSLEADIHPQISLYNRLLTQTVNYRYGGRTPNGILKDNLDG